MRFWISRSPSTDGQQRDMRFSILLSAVLLTGIGAEQPGQSTSSNAASLSHIKHGSGTLRFATLNVKSEDSDAPWNQRRLALVMSVLKEDADVIGFQDASARQAKDISNGLKRKYACHCIEAGRKAEVMVLCHKKRTIDREDIDYFWLSSTPSKSGSTSWGARRSRVVQLGQFELKSTGETFWVVNAHFDDETQKAREESARLLLNRVRGIVQGKETDYKPLVVILGNLNVQPDDDAYHILTGNRYLTYNENLREIEPYTFIDLERSSGDDLSAITYKPRKREENNYHTRETSHYIMASDNGALAEKCWKIEEVDEVSNTFNWKGDRVSYSDHRMLVAEVTKD